MQELLKEDEDKLKRFSSCLILKNKIREVMQTHGLTGSIRISQSCKTISILYPGICVASKKSKEYKDFKSVKEAVIKSLGSIEGISINKVDTYSFSCSGYIKVNVIN